MTRSISSIAKKIATTSFAAIVGVTVLGSAAHAHEPTVQQRAEAEMNQGKDYVAARNIATRDTEPAYSPELVATFARAEDALQQGKDYVDAWAAESNPTGSDFSPEQIAKAKLAQDEMSHGLDYVAAWEAADESQPASVGVAQLGGSGDRATR